MTSFMVQEELRALGFAALGKDVRVSAKASIYEPERIALGNNVRVDDFCVLSAGEEGITVGNYVHIAVYASLIGAGRIVLEDFANLSSRVSIYSSNDDYSGESLTNPTVPDEYKRVQHAAVTVGRHVILGSGVVVLPGVTIAEGTAVGSLSLVSADTEPFGIYAGIPARRLGDRSRNLLLLERQLLDSTQEPW